MIAGWLTALSRHAEALVPAVLVTVTEARGSAPRDGGSKMVFTATGQDDTIGGGALEHECGRIAREMLGSGVSRPVTRKFPLGPALGQCCGGHVTVLFEPILPTSWNVVVFGAGHVGQAVVKLLATLPCRVTWVDARRELFAQSLPNNVVCTTNTVPDAVVLAGAMVVVMSHDHQLDYQIVRSCLARDDLGFVGLIGSGTKRARFLSRLSSDGVAQAGLERLTCPIGLFEVPSKLPAEIALSAVAQLLSLRTKQLDSTGKVVPDPLATPRIAAVCQGCDAAQCLERRG